VDVGTVGIHDGKTCAGEAVILVAHADATRGKDNAVVGQISRLDVMVRAERDLLEASAVDVDFPDVPPGVIVAAEYGFGRVAQNGFLDFYFCVVSIFVVESASEQNLFAIP